MVESLHARYVRWLLDSTPQTIRRWVPEEQLRHELAEHFDQVWVEQVETPEWLAGYARACSVDGAEPPDYRMREIQVLPDAAVLAGIHFRHRDVHHPFVGVFAQSRDLNDAEMETATSALGEAFRLFNPHTVRWWAPEQRDMSMLPGAAGDDRLVVGRIQDVTSAPLPLLPDRFSFEPEGPARTAQRCGRKDVGGWCTIRCL